MPKVISISVSDSSDLADRFRRIGVKLNKYHRELLERWVGAEEAGVIPDVIEKIEKRGNKRALPDVDGLLARVSALEEKIAEIEARTDKQTTAKTEKAASLAPRPAKQKKQKQPKKQAKQAKTKASLPTARRPDPAPSRAVILAQVYKLQSAGLSHRKIADRLIADKVPTLSGKGSWKAGTVSNLLKKNELSVRKARSQ